MNFSARRFHQELKTEQFGRVCRAFVETTSTIDDAWEWLRAGGPEGGLVVAERQTQARGRMGRKWVSPEGGLWMSLLTRPNLEAGSAGRLGIAMALAAAISIGGETTVKWPNDVLIRGRKLGGVLVESEASNGYITAAVISLGLNINVSWSDLPRNLQDTAASLQQESRYSYFLEIVAAQVLGNLEQLWPAVQGDGEALVERWRAFDAFLGQMVSLAIGEQVLQGRDEGIDRDGALLLAMNGELRRISVGEVTGVGAPQP